MRISDWSSDVCSSDLIAVIGPGDEAFDVTRTDDRDAAIAAVRKGDLDLALEQDGDTLIAHYTQTDQVKAAMVNGLLLVFVDSTNIAVTGQQPKFDLPPERGEDDQMKMVDFVPLGLLVWALPLGAAVG